MKTRIDKQPLYHRFSTLSDTVPKCVMSRKLYKSNHSMKKKPDVVKEQDQTHDPSHEQTSYLERLHKEAYDELRLQIQHYNDDFINRMRYLEQTRDFLYKEEEEEDEEMKELEESFGSTSVKDYSQLVEWESCRLKAATKKPVST